MLSKVNKILHASLHLEMLPRCVWIITHQRLGIIEGDIDTTKAPHKRRVYNSFTINLTGR